MLEQPHPPEENGPEYTGSELLPPDASKGTAAPDPRLEDYLDQVYAPLVNRVPYARRQELRRELRDHLEARVATYRELGSGPEVAVEEALRQFGEPGELARRCVEEWQRGVTGRSPQRVWPAMLVALGCFGLLAPFYSTLVAVLHAAGYQASGWWMLPMFVLATFLAGLTTGVAAPGRPVLGTLLALTLLPMPTMLQHLAIWAHSSGWEVAVHGWWWGVGQVVTRFLGPWVGANLFMMPLGCAGAALGGRLRARLVAKRGRWVVQ